MNPNFFAKLESVASICSLPNACIVSELFLTGHQGIDFPSVTKMNFVTASGAVTKFRTFC